MSSSSNSADAVLKVQSHSGGPWQTSDPFLFCVHHVDKYPNGNDKMGPAASLAGRNIGSDFGGKDGWNMYHGVEGIPGFPQHPHRGFETITVVRQGLVDHSDSLGATARFGAGDTQWVTAGSGIVHSEMFPLVHRDKSNTMELFQIWLNLPKKNKMVKPYFTMLWAEQTPIQTFTDASSKKTTVQVIAGELQGVKPLPPPPESWASDPKANFALWSVAMESGAKWTLPAATVASGSKAPTRTVHIFSGAGFKIAGKEVLMKDAPMVAVTLKPTEAVEVEATAGAVEFLVMQGTAIDEPVAQRGPFVMNTQSELAEAFADYRRTQFGGWPFGSDAPVHPREQQRFAKHAGGKIDNPSELKQVK